MRNMGLPPAAATFPVHTAAGRSNRSQERAREGSEGARKGSQVLTTAVGLQRDITGQRELHEGCYYTGVEPPGLPQQALGCVWELETRVDPIWKDLQGVFTSGLMTGREVEQGATDTVRGHTAWQDVPAGWPGFARPQSGSLLLLLFPLPGPPPLIYWFLSVFQLSLEFTSPGNFPDAVGGVRGPL